MWKDACGLPQACRDNRAANLPRDPLYARRDKVLAVSLFPFSVQSIRLARSEAPCTTPNPLPIRNRDFHRPARLSRAHEAIVSPPSKPLLILLPIVLVCRVQASGSPPKPRPSRCPDHPPSRNPPCIILSVLRNSPPPVAKATSFNSRCGYGSPRGPILGQKSRPAGPDALHTASCPGNTRRVRRGWAVDPSTSLDVRPPPYEPKAWLCTHSLEFNDPSENRT